MTLERRADQRITYELPVHIVRGRTLEPVAMREVSYRGLFVRLASPPALRELIKLRIDLPRRELVTHAVVARVIGADTSGLFGVALRLFALRDGDKNDWEGFIAALIPRRRAAA